MTSTINLYAHFLDFSPIGKNSLLLIYLNQDLNKDLTMHLVVLSPQCILSYNNSLCFFSTAILVGA